MHSYSYFIKICKQDQQSRKKEKNSTFMTNRQKISAKPASKYVRTIKMPVLRELVIDLGPGFISSSDELCLALEGSPPSYALSHITSSMCEMAGKPYIWNPFINHHFKLRNSTWKYMVQQYDFTKCIHKYILCHTETFKK